MAARRAFLAIPAAAAVLAGVAACQVLLGIDDPDAAQRPPDAAAPSATICLGAQPPAKKGDDTGVGAPLFFALKTVSTLRDGGAAGYNVDRHCTFADADLPCVGSPDDADGGIDNAVQKLVAGLPGAGGPDPLGDDVNEKIAAGRQGVFFALYHWSGQPDDGLIQLGIVPAIGLVGSDCDASAPRDIRPPKWDGCDVWSLGAITLPQGNILANAQPGWVAGGTLVASYAELPITLGVLSIRVVDAVVTARLVQADGGWSLVDGTLGGRLRTAEFIQEASELIVPGVGHSPVCKVFPGELRDAVCKLRDLRLGDDDPSAQCDGLSIGLAFEAEAVALGIPGDAGPGPACPPIDTSCP